MLNKLHTVRRHRLARARQRGAVLLIALIMLVALTMAGLALMRSVSTSNIIAGNLAFQQAATHSAGAGIETAVSWLQANTANTTLHSSILTGSGMRYVAQRQDPTSGQSWDAVGTGTLAGSGAVNALPADAAGNTVSFVIHRLCNSTGAPTYPGCSAPAVDVQSAGNSFGSGVIALNQTRQVYYRITARVTGPRNTLSYVQAVVSQ
jgi:type IV pilus assembly protein PilX